MNDNVVNVYSKAFFQLSDEKDKLDLHKENLSYVKEVFDNNADFSKLIENPNISKVDKKDALKQVFSNTDRDVQNLLNVLIDKSRFDILLDLIRDFNKKYNESKGIMEGIVYSANDLSDRDLNDIKQALEKKFSKKIELQNIIDKSLISGVSIYLDGKRIDNSIKNRLEMLRTQLTKEGE